MADVAGEPNGLSNLFLIAFNSLYHFGRNRKLKYYLIKQSDATVFSIFALRFLIIPWSLRNSSKPWSCCMCRDTKVTTKAVSDYRRAERPFEGIDNNFDRTFNFLRKIQTSAARRNSFHVNCTSAYSRKLPRTSSDGTYT
jgi:hypothetical protein